MKTSLKKIGAELILSAMVLPWAIWVTVGIFSSRTAEAVQETKYDLIVKRLDEIKTEIKEIKR